MDTTLSPFNLRSISQQQNNIIITLFDTDKSFHLKNIVDFISVFLDLEGNSFRQLSLHYRSE